MPDVPTDAVNLFPVFIVTVSAGLILCYYGSRDGWKTSRLAGGVAFLCLAAVIGLYGVSVP